MISDQYDENKFYDYVPGTDTTMMSYVLPVELLEIIDLLVADPRTPFRNRGQFVRNAVIHRLVAFEKEFEEDLGSGFWVDIEEIGA